MPSHIYSKIYLHISWHTRDNLPSIKRDIEQPLYGFLRKRAAQARHTECLEIGGTEDHVHLAVRVPPTLLISEWIGQMKGASAHYINEWLPRFGLHWQQGYGVVSFSERALDKVREYIRNQKQHHSRGTVVEGLEQTCSDEEEAP
jgi:REP element-mobilizing transposase RayT